MPTQAAEQRRNTKHFSSFRKLAWAPHLVLLGLLSICSMSAKTRFVLPFIGFDVSQFPLFWFFPISSKGPSSFWISSDLLLSVQSQLAFFQTHKKLFFEPLPHSLFGWREPSKIFHKALVSCKSLMKLFTVEPAEKKNLKELTIAYQTDHEKKCFLVLSCLFA